MEVLVISSFFVKSDNSRPYLAYKYFKKYYDTKVIYSDFNHSGKKYNLYDDNDMIGVHTTPYKKNISFNRIKSHIKFSLNALKELKKYNPKMVYVNVPPNILGFIITRYCKKKNIKVICDIVDLWPEAFPINNKVGFIFNNTIGVLWRKMRSYSLKSSDICIAESEYFSEKFLKKHNVNTIYLAKILEGNYIKNYMVDIDEIVIGYVGSISNIYDFESLVDILSRIKKKKKVLLKIIGDGERKEWLISELEKNKISYKYYGKVFNENEKAKILGDCLFGYNGYKNETEVALSYKSLDYLSYGIPLINSTKGDTKYIVEKYKIGINFNSSNIDFLVEDILGLKEDELMEMRNNAFKVFNELFSWESFVKSMDRVLNIKI